MEESALKSLFEEIGGTYHREGDYFLPDLVLPESVPIGIWGQRRWHHLKTQREPIYTAGMGWADEQRPKSRGGNYL